MYKIFKIMTNIYIQKSKANYISNIDTCWREINIEEKIFLKIYKNIEDMLRNSPKDFVVALAASTTFIW